MVYFEAENIVNHDTLMEIKWYIPTPTERLVYALGPLAGILGAVGAFMLSYYLLAVPFLVLFFGSILAYPWHLSRVVKLDLARLKETRGTDEVKSSLFFMDESVKICNTASEAEIYIKYEDFKRSAHTKNFFVLFTKANLSLAVNKASIIKKQEDVKFREFVRSRCKI